MDKSIKKLVKELKQLQCYGKKVRKIELDIPNFSNKFLIRIHCHFYHTDSLIQCNLVMYKYKFKLLSIERDYCEYGKDLSDIINEKRVEGLKNLLKR